MFFALYILAFLTAMTNIIVNYAIYEERLNASEQRRSLKSYQEAFFFQTNRNLKVVIEVKTFPPVL